MPHSEQWRDEHHIPVAAAAARALMGREITLDVRGLEPPQPLERILETIGDFTTGDRLKVLIDCEPKPLYRILERNGYGHHAEPGADALYEITIWPKE